MVKEDNKRFNILKIDKAKDRLIYTRESYDEFPDLWVADSSFGTKKS